MIFRYRDQQFESLETKVEICVEIMRTAPYKNRMEAVEDKKTGNHFRRKVVKRKIITPQRYGILSREDLQEARELFKRFREQAVSK